MNEITEHKYINGTDVSLHGAFRISDNVVFEISADAEDVVMEIHPDSMPDLHIPFEDMGGGVFVREIDMRELCTCDDGGLYWYRYRITFADGSTEYYGGEAPLKLEPCSHVGDRQLLVYRDDFTTPDRFKGCVIYHVFVDRFRKGGDYPLKDGALAAEWDSDIPEYGEQPGDKVKNNYFYGGDIDGIIEKAYLKGIEDVTHLNADQCIRCGICSYVCPSGRRLTEYVGQVKKGRV